MNYNYIFYDAYGQILSIYAGAEPQKQTVEGSIGYALINDNFISIEDTYYNTADKTFAAKTATDLNIPSKVDVNASVSFTVPADCYVTVNNDKHTSGTVTIDTSEVSGFRITVRGKLKYEQYITILSYSQKRAAEYPSIIDQLDELYHNGIDGWKAKIKEVKDKYPKS